MNLKGFFKFVILGEFLIVKKANHSKCGIQNTEQNYSTLNCVTMFNKSGFYLLGGGGGKLPPKRLSFSPEVFLKKSN